jgi:cell division protein ZapE
MDNEKPLLKRYEKAILQNELTFDSHQQEAIAHLQRLLDELHTYGNKRVRLKRWQWKSPTVSPWQGLYLFGDVGRGKSMLMTWFYDDCQLAQKRRVHFHVFMQEVHAFIHQTQTHNALPKLAKTVRQNTQLLCFDEFYISDIADAMLLSRLFSALFREGVIIVITSNYHPDSLYPNGLQRSSVLPFIALLREKTALIELSGKQDYRLTKTKHQTTRYFFPLNPETEKALINHTPNRPTCVTYTFAQLCGEPKGAKDYLALVQNISHLVLTHIPPLTQDKNNETRRFITLIDVLYEYNVVLLCSAQVAIDELCLEESNQLDFHRTRSRLIEMQSANYPHSL